jgi:methylated-DNA-[protein]-cysteine S-methyltransferase
MTMKVEMAIQLGRIDTPVGRLTLAARDGRTCLLHFDTREGPARTLLGKWYPGEPVEMTRDPGGAATVLRRYFDGDVHALDDVPVEMNGTEFQKRVWEALRSVRAGQTSSYAALAKRIGSPAAVRAVGAANGANPVAIIVPCHRVIGANGSLTGYGGGLHRKEWLLRHENARLV